MQSTYTVSPNCKRRLCKPPPHVRGSRSLSRHYCYFSKLSRQAGRVCVPGATALISKHRGPQRRQRRPESVGPAAPPPPSFHPRPGAPSKLRSPASRPARPAQVTTSPNRKSTREAHARHPIPAWRRRPPGRGPVCGASRSRDQVTTPQTRRPPRLPRPQLCARPARPRPRRLPAGRGPRSGRGGGRGRGRGKALRHPRPAPRSPVPRRARLAGRSQLYRRRPGPSARSAPPAHTRARKTRSPRPPLPPPPARPSRGARAPAPAGLGRAEATLHRQRRAQVSSSAPGPRRRGDETPRAPRRRGGGRRGAQEWGKVRKEATAAPPEPRKVDAASRPPACAGDAAAAAANGPARRQGRREPLGGETR